MPFGGILTAGVIGGISSLIQGILGSQAANNASQAQIDAANRAIDSQERASNNALLLQLGTYTQTREDQMPWLQAGRGGLSRLSQLLGVDSYTGRPRAAAGTTTTPGGIPYTDRPGAGLGTDPQPGGGTVPIGGVGAGAGKGPAVPIRPATSDLVQQPDGTWAIPTPALSGVPTGAGTPTGGTLANLAQFGDEMDYTVDPRGADFGELTQGFAAPAHFQYDPARLTEDPGYQFRLKEGQRALERSAASKGAGLGGGTLRALTEYGQGMGSQEYAASYGRAAGEYDRNFTNDFNVFNTNQTNKYNRLASLAGIGQTAATTLSNANQTYANQAGQTILNTGQGVADTQLQAGNARASGYVGAANAWTGALGNIAQMGTDLYGLKRYGINHNQTLVRYQ